MKPKLLLCRGAQEIRLAGRLSAFNEHKMSSWGKVIASFSEYKLWPAKRGPDCLVWLLLGTWQIGYKGLSQGTCMFDYENQSVKKLFSCLIKRTPLGFEPLQFSKL
ncbi:hypothetical protein AYJ01_17355 [Shewanella algae]|nr:hypothetical protein DD549_12595 [Shewanella algae]TVK91788.1 hypothetical protein AYJ01_17355 [Shewanella algae]